MLNDGDIVAVFASIHRVMKAEKILKAELQGIKVIPMPRKISADCGMAIKFPEVLLAQVEQILKVHAIEVLEFWQKHGDDLEALP